MILKIESLRKGSITISGDMTYSFSPGKYSLFKLRVQKSNDSSPVFYDDIVSYREYTDNMQLISAKSMKDTHKTTMDHIKYNMEQDDIAEKKKYEDMRKNWISTRLFRNEEHIGNIYHDGRVEYLPGYGPNGKIDKSILEMIFGL